MDKIIFAREWDATDLCGHGMSLSNGNQDRQKYLNWLDENEWIKNNSMHYPEIYERMVYDNTRNFVSVSLSEIPENTKYVYSIPLKNQSNYFLPKFKNGFDISERVISDVKNGLALIVFDYLHEGILGKQNCDDMTIINEIIGKLNLPKDRLLLLHGDFNTKKFENAPYQYCPIDVFPHWIPYHNDKEFNDRGIIDYIPHKLYVTYNSILYDRQHRFCLIFGLLHHDLLKVGTVSIGRYTPWDENLTLVLLSLVKGSTREEVELLANKFLDYRPDVYNQEQPPFAGTIKFDQHRSAFLSIVSETISAKDLDFFSEKIYKPISIGHPFILNGSPHQLKRLRSMGLKTFSKWWDESYDDIEDTGERVEAIVKVVSDLNKLSMLQLVEIRNEMEETLIHNKETFYRIRSEWNNDNPVMKAIRSYL